MDAALYDSPRRRASTQFEIVIASTQDCEYRGTIVHVETGETVAYDGILGLLEAIQGKLNEDNRLQATHKMRSWPGRQGKAALSS